MRQSAVAVAWMGARASASSSKVSGFATRKRPLRRAEGDWHGDRSNPAISGWSFWRFELDFGYGLNQGLVYFYRRSLVHVFCPELDSPCYPSGKFHRNLWSKRKASAFSSSQLVDYILDEIDDHLKLKKVFFYEMKLNKHWIALQFHHWVDRSYQIPTTNFSLLQEAGAM